jgi:hypothetical protein
MLMPGGVRHTRGISLDLSEAGIGALVQGDLKTGNVVEMEFSLPARELTAIAIVRHSSSVRSGFEFLGLTNEERHELGMIVGEGHSRQKILRA